MNEMIESPRLERRAKSRKITDDDEASYEDVLFEEQGNQQEGEDYPMELAEEYVPMNVDGPEGTLNEGFENGENFDVQDAGANQKLQQQQQEQINGNEEPMQAEPNAEEAQVDFNDLSDQDIMQIIRRHTQEIETTYSADPKSTRKTVGMMIFPNKTLSLPTIFGYVKEFQNIGPMSIRSNKKGNVMFTLTDMDIAQAQQYTMSKQFKDDIKMFEKWQVTGAGSVVIFFFEVARESAEDFGKLFIAKHARVDPIAYGWSTEGTGCFWLQLSNLSEFSAHVKAEGQQTFSFRIPDGSLTTYQYALGADSFSIDNLLLVNNKVQINNGVLKRSIFNYSGFDDVEIIGVCLKKHTDGLKYHCIIVSSKAERNKLIYKIYQQRKTVSLGHNVGMTVVPWEDISSEIAKGLQGIGEKAAPN